jgi:hypothetical protein
MGKKNPLYEDLAAEFKNAVEEVRMLKILNQPEKDATESAISGMAIRVGRVFKKHKDNFNLDLWHKACGL